MKRCSYEPTKVGGYIFSIGRVIPNYLNVQIRTVNIFNKTNINHTHIHN